MTIRRGNIITISISQKLARAHLEHVVVAKNIVQGKVQIIQKCDDLRSKQFAQTQLL